MAKSSTTGASLPIDPTANVLALVAAEQKRQDDLRVAAAERQDDLRDLTTHWRDKVDELERGHSREMQALEQTTNLARAAAEQGRIDALLAANTNNVALALEKQGAQALAQDRRISVLEQNQYSGAGRELGTDKAASSRTVSQGQLLTVMLVAIAALTFLKLIHVF